MSKMSNKMKDRFEQMYFEKILEKRKVVAQLQKLNEELKIFRVQMKLMTIQEEQEEQAEQEKEKEKEEEKEEKQKHRCKQCVKTTVSVKQSDKKPSESNLTMVTRHNKRHQLDDAKEQLLCDCGAPINKDKSILLDNAYCSGHRCKKKIRNTIKFYSCTSDDCDNVLCQSCMKAL